MKTFIIEKFPRIIKNRKRLEKKLNVRITNRGKEITIDGKPEDEYIAEKVILALDFGFPFSTAMEIKKNDYEFEVLNIKDYTNKKNLGRIRARIIGKKGRTLKTLAELTNCNFELKDNSVGIIGRSECIKNAQDSVTFVIRGSKQGNVYSYLEKHQVKPIIDFGLKE